MDVKFEEAAISKIWQFKLNSNLIYLRCSTFVSFILFALMRYEHIDNKYYQLSLKSSIFQICTSLIKLAQLLEQIMMSAQK